MAAAIVIYWGALALFAPGGLKFLHLLAGSALLLLAYGGPRFREAMRFCFPFILTGMLYDSQRYFGPLLRGRIRVEELYRWELSWFGIGGLTPNEWWQQHLHPALDLLGGLLYLNFITGYVAIAFAFYVLENRAVKAAWAFLWVDLLGCSTYYWYPAAPPWYVAQHGFGPARLDAAASPAGCARFDQLLGTHIFDGMYGMGANVFGSVPSLHVAYPLMAIYFAFRYGRLRVTAIGFYVLMCFSAVYLNHHYVVDLLWGSAYGLVVAWATDRFDLVPSAFSSGSALALEGPLTQPRALEG